jgi:hypothetical protein
VFHLSCSSQGVRASTRLSASTGTCCRRRSALAGVITRLPAVAHDDDRGGLRERLAGTTTDAPRLDGSRPALHHGLEIRTRDADKFLHVVDDILRK